MFILETGSEFFTSRIQIFSIPDLKEFKFLNPKNCSKLSETWSGLLIPDPDPDFVPIPDPGAKKTPKPGSQIRIRNTGFTYTWRGEGQFSSGPG